MCVSLRDSNRRGIEEALAAAEGITAVALDDDGTLVEFAPDRSSTTAPS